VVDLLGGVLFGALRAVRNRLRRPRSREAHEPRVILLVQLDHLGDALISTVMLPMLRRRWPHASIEVLASPANREVFYAMPEVDRVHVCRDNRFARHRRLPLAWLIALVGWGLFFRRRNVDLAIDPRGEFPLALLLWLTGAPRRLGWNCGGGRFLLTDSPAYVPGRPEVASRLALLERLGIVPLPQESCFPRFRPSTKKGSIPVLPESPQDCLEKNSDVPFCRPRIVVHVGAGTPAKRWPAAHWAVLVAQLRRRDAQLTLVGSSADRAVAEEIVAAAAGVSDWTGRLDLEQLAALLEQADLFIGADSGPAHLAAAVGTPVVALFSGTNQPDQWRPRGSPVVVLRNAVACSPCHRQRCPRPDHPCMKELDPRLVLTAADSMLARRTPPPARRASEADTQHQPDAPARETCQHQPDAPARETKAVEGVTA
jgi:lipopolysaccharide heptosyltransferase II